MECKNIVELADELFRMASGTSRKINWLRPTEALAELAKFAWLEMDGEGVYIDVADEPATLAITVGFAKLNFRLTARYRERDELQRIEAVFAFDGDPNGVRCTFEPHPFKNIRGFVGRHSPRSSMAVVPYLTGLAMAVPTDKRQTFLELVDIAFSHAGDEDGDVYRTRVRELVKVAEEHARQNWWSNKPKENG